MAVSLVLAPEAELDISEAYIWYETRRSGLGEDFLTSVDASIHRIRRHPWSFPLVHNFYRRALIRRFPYAIFFEVAGHAITIYGVFHTSRHPQKWRQRLP